MASTSGRVGSGTYNYTYFYFQWQLGGQDTNGNYSVINWQWGINISGGAYWGSNAIKSVSGYVEGNLVFGANTWSNQSGNGDHQLLSGSINIGHNGDGTKTFSISSTGWFWDGGNYGNSGSWELPTIPRYATIDGYNIDWTTDAAIRFAWHADRGCDYISWWSTAYDGGGHHDEYVGNSQGWFVKELYNLPSEKTFDVKVAVRNAASGLWTESGTAYPATGKQSKMFKVL